MAWTAPITHNTGDVFPASDWNTYIRDNLLYLFSGRPAAFAYHAGAQSVAASTLTVLNADSELIDQGPAAMHDLVTNNPRITIPETGIYLIGSQASWASAGTGTYREDILRKNGTTIIVDSVNAAVLTAGSTASTAPVPAALNATDYIEHVVRQDGSGALNVSGGFTSSFHWAVRVT